MLENVAKMVLRTKQIKLRGLDPGWLASTGSSVRTHVTNVLPRRKEHTCLAQTIGMGARTRI